MKKRSCERFQIPGVTVFLKKRSLLFNTKFPDDYFPVLDLSRGGARFLSNHKFTPGTDMTVRFDIPGHQTTPEILASICWISRNPEASYRYQTGISFNPYGPGKADNPLNILQFFEVIEEGLH